MKKSYIQEFYTSPEMKVVEVQARKMICESGDIVSMYNDDEQNLDW